MMPGMSVCASSSRAGREREREEGGQSVYYYSNNFILFPFPFAEVASHIL